MIVENFFFFLFGKNKIALIISIIVRNVQELLLNKKQSLFKTEQMHIRLISEKRSILDRVSV